MRLTRFRLLFLVSVALLAMPASAKIFLKPSGSNTIAPRLKSLTTHVTIAGQFATTTQNLVFLNENEKTMEAQFIYTLPPGAVATYFAYWAQDEKVVARIVEKRRAAQIYQYVSRPMHDPALVELIGKNTFRARVYPVFPNEDLRVEIHYVEPLQSTTSGASYALSMFNGKDEPPLDELNVNVHILPGSGFSGVTNNYGLPVTRSSDGWHMTLAGTFYRPPKDLRIQLKRNPAPLQAPIYSARSGGDGFFALALTPNHSLSKPKLAVTGVSTYDTLGMPKTLKANQAVIIRGRYRGSGKATVTLEGVSPDGPYKACTEVQFSARSETGNLASKLWAAAKIEQMSAREANRAGVILLSRQFVLPSKWTSWLAVPKSEQDMLNEAKPLATARELAELLASDRHSAAEERRLRAQLAAECKVIRSDPQETLANAQSDLHSNVESELADLVIRQQDNTPRGRWLRELFNKFIGPSEAKRHEALTEAIAGHAWEAAQDLVDERYARTKDPVRLADAEKRIRRIEKLTGKSVKDRILDFEGSYIEVLRDQLLKEYANPHPDQAKIQRLREHFIEVDAHARNMTHAVTRADILKLLTDEDALTGKAQAAYRAGDTQKQAEYEAQVKALQDKERELRVRLGDPQIVVNAPADAQRVIALMPGGELKTLTYNPNRHYWEAKFDIPVYAKEGTYTIRILITLADGTEQTQTQHYTVDLTAPKGTAHAILTANGKLRLEMDADPDTARVVALTPWNGRIELMPSSQPHRFFEISNVPQGDWSSSEVTFILTDKAHNRTTMSVKVEAGQ